MNNKGEIYLLWCQHLSFPFIFTTGFRGCLILRGKMGLDVDDYECLAGDGDSVPLIPTNGWRTACVPGKVWGIAYFFFFFNYVWHKANN